MKMKQPITEILIYMIFWQPLSWILKQIKQILPAGKHIADDELKKKTPTEEKIKKLLKITQKKP